jgi:hypothetical protein
MTTPEAMDRFDAKRRPALVQSYVVQAQWVMSACIGFTWGGAAMHFLTRLTGTIDGMVLVGTLAACAICAWLGFHLPDAYFRLTDPERTRRFYRRWGLVQFRHWMVDGDWMNRRLRKIMPTYRVLPARSEDIGAYSQRARRIEMLHLAWLLGSLPLLVVALLYRFWNYSAFLALLTIVTNIFPVLLQRFNRAGCELVLQRRRQMPMPADRLSPKSMNHLDPPPRISG